MRWRILLSVFISFFAGQLLAQQPQGVNANAIGISATGTGTFYYADRKEPARAIEFKAGTVTTSSFHANINQYFGIPAEFSFSEIESNTDHLGMRHRHMQQYYKGIPVEGMGYRVHEKDGFVKSANGRAVRNIDLNTQVSIGEQYAHQLAVRYLQTKDTTFRNGRKLIVSKNFAFTPESFFLAFQFDIDVSLIEQWRISIDAHSGNVINKVSLVNSCFTEETPPLPYGTGTGLTTHYGNKTIQLEKYSNGGSRLVGETANGGKIGTYDFRNADLIFLDLFWSFHKFYDITSPTTTYNNPRDKPAISVQWAAEQAYEYYYKKHNRKSFDNNGAPITSYVHVAQDLNNAFWTHNLMAFGDGSNNNPLVELDVVGHELTHGVTQYEARLQYSNEPGALNESFSDIFGKVIEFHTFGDTATWRLARRYNGGLRDMSDPNLKDQPDTYGGAFWYTGVNDSGGVHTNSGVQNFWFYLLCKGGSGVNDNQVSYTVTSIGMDAAVNIAYRNLTEYLSNNSDYLDSRIGSLLATADLYGNNSAIYQEVVHAWDAVGVIDEPIITSLEVYDITATTVKIKGSLLPRGDNVTYHFEYGTTPAFGRSSSTYGYNGKIENALTGLQSQTKYYLRLVATNENGSSYFGTEFTTISLAPLVKIKQTVDVTETTATLHGQINPNSLPTSFYFEYGTTPSFGSVTPTYSLSGMTEYLNVSAALTNLQPRQNYYYRLVATNSFSSVRTGSESFFTAVKPVINSFAPATASIDAEVTITGQNFNLVRDRNVVSFGATNASVLSSSSTMLKVKVPAGASLGPITVLDAESGLSTASAREFVPTFTGDFQKGSMQLRVGVNEPGIWTAIVQDIDGDNKPDIVTMHSQGFSVFQNVNQGGDITAESFVRNTFNVVDFTYSELHVADLDGNGLKDIVGRYPKGLRVYPNFSVPGFVFFGTPVDLPMESIDQLIFSDFDLDGHIDIANFTGVAYQRTVLRIFRNQNPKGHLSAQNFEQRDVKTLSYSQEYLTAGDLNNDGKPDLLAGSNYTDYLSILRNNSRPGVFEFEESTVQDPTRGNDFVRYVSHDLNQDGWRDIISHSPNVAANLALMENKGTSPNITLEPAGVVSRYLAAIQAGDMNGDGKVDLLAGFSNREFAFLQNKTIAGGHLSGTSFEKFETYGMSVGDVESGKVRTKMAVNDLNGDGRPEVINVYSYYYGPRDGYMMEVWQNSSTNNCLDPSMITLEVSKNSINIILPPNTTLDQFEIEYAPANGSNWIKVSSTTVNYLTTNYSYKLRARAKCYLDFTAYHYINFKTDCVDSNSFSVSNIGISEVFLYANDLGSLEIQYSPADKNQWVTLPQYSNRISNLLPGTTYDLRFRGRNCYANTEFRNRQFTTLCPKLSTLNITNLTFNRATVSWTSNYTGKAIIEYSLDNVNWTLADESGTMVLPAPAKLYFVRGRMACTNLNSDFITTSFTAPCPKVSTIFADNIGPFSARINWIDESNTGSYTLSYSLPGGASTIVETNTTSFELKDLNPGTRYAVTVTPHCSGPRTFTSADFNTVCYTPFNLSANNVTYTTAELLWNDNFSGVAYSVDYSIVGSNVWRTSEATSTNILLEELRPGTRYEARVHINCTSETPPYAAALFETNFYNETAVTPNPTDGKITIHPSKNLLGNGFNIYDNAGRMIANGQLLDYTIDLTNFSPGLYVLKIDGENILRIVKY